jgi:haloacetate dehalogenase
VTAGKGPPLCFCTASRKIRHVGAGAPILAADFTVVCADLRGYGDRPPRCTPDRSNYSFRAMARDQAG